MNSIPPVLPAPAKPKNTFYHQAATCCLAAPFVSIGFSIMLNSARMGHRGSVTRGELIVMALISSFIILSGFVLGIISLFGIRRYGREGILWKAVTGLLIVVFLALAAIPNILAAREKARQKREQIIQKSEP